MVALQYFKSLPFWIAKAEFNIKYIKSYKGSTWKRITNLRVPIIVLPGRHSNL